MLTVLPTPASRFAMLPGETPQEPARLDHPSFAACVEALRALLEIAAAYQVPAGLLRADREPLAAPAPVPEAVA